jgi:transposase
LSYNFLPYDQKQLLLMPPSLDEWVEEGSLARFVSDVVDQMDGREELSAFYARYREDGWGRAAYPPRMMVKVIL